ncbi:hypothetical protein [Lacticaseibacillus paracasei]|uniref:Uncharacterized protein n=1 Tax=Lacticaseibacillus paracasei NRIC 0644 TaxID=1435038 RepID=A0A0C9QCG2_LACPA|nr:hypothetical protein [Lacticaseibacillus paracasei]GAN37487.1 hypothetical protein LC0644_2076 [Lacticaseibacillus paracasei NRIC 0644]GAN38171.1 hypothetical protein LC1917_0048 [Lacticaseibacillus paracasei NRIC 1917]
MNGKEFEALLDDVKNQLKTIRMYANTGDDGNAHGYEDDLYWFVMNAIREKNMTMEQAKQLINESFKARDIDFSHWYE